MRKPAFKTYDEDTVWLVIFVGACLALCFTILCFTCSVPLGGFSFLVLFCWLIRVLVLLR